MLGVGLNFWTTAAGGPLGSPWWLPGSAVDLNFATGNYHGDTLANLISCSRASSGYATNADGTLTSFGPNVPRIGVGAGLLVEEARTNLFLQSSLAANAAWGMSALTPTPSSGIGIEGNNTVTLLTSTGAGSFHMGGPLTVPTGPVTHWRVLKVGTVSSPWLSVWDSGHHEAQFSLVGAGSVLSFDAGITASIKYLGNGFYLCAVTWTMVGTTAYGAMFLDGNGEGSGGIAGSSVYQDIAQFEVGAFPTSYIPTTTAAVTRAADVVSLTGAALTTVQAATMSAIFKCGPSPNPGATVRILNNGTDVLLIGPGATDVNYYSGGSLSAVGGDVTAGSVKMGISHDGSGRSIVGNNGTVVTGATIGASIANFSLGSDGGAIALDGYFQRMTLWNSRLADATLKSLTA